MNKENEDNFEISHLIFGHSTYNERADHSRKCAHSIRNTHQYAGIPWRNVQVVDIKTLERGRIKKRNSEILGNIYFIYFWMQVNQNGISKLAMKSITCQCVTTEL